MNPKSSFYLPALDGLRFFAFFLVFMHHFPAPPQSASPLLFSICTSFQTFGWIGVDLFLCLSSYLLTSLILLEYKTYHCFNIKHFFIRRSLRIWPLYYGMLFLVFIIFPLLKTFFSHWEVLYSYPFNHYEYIKLFKIHFLPFLFFLGNLSYAASPPSSIWLAPLWTISLEEQFYLFYPVLFYILLSKHKKYWAGLTVLGFCIAFLSRLYISINHIPYPAMWTFSLARIDPFIFGSLLGFMNQRKKQINGHFSLLLCLSLSITYIWLSKHFNLEISILTKPFAILTLFLSSLICISLINATLQIPILFHFFSIPFLRFLGKISFGLYVFHVGCIYAIFYYIKPSSLLVWLSCLTLTFTLTFLLAYFSYTKFEKKFLLLKKKFTLIQSRPV